MSAAPGRAGALVAVVGPSGAGKDTLLAIARDLVAGDDGIVFARRVVTRESSAAEDHDSMPAEVFEDAVRRGAFAFWWAAHGLKYGVPSRVDDALADGKAVVCNVSRAIVPHLRGRYASCQVVLIDAPREIRMARIRARGRAADGDTAARVDRDATAGEPLAADLVIENVGDPRAGGHMLARLLRTAAARSRAGISLPGIRERPAVRALAPD